MLRQGARSENILYGSLNDEQRRRSAKDPATLRAEFWRAADGVAPQSQNARLCSFVAPCQPPARNSAHPVPIYEMGSKLQLAIYFCSVDAAMGAGEESDVAAVSPAISE